ncbi:MAG: hypothetical protein IKN54_04365 [Lachnospiraceae bacterium]|nr:hypothetical protein [Lachnospiraceae bacterium]
MSGKLYVSENDKIMKDKVYYVHLTYLQKDAIWQMWDWVDKHRPEITIVNKVRYFVDCKNGSRHYFLGEHIYSSWCKGRYYILNGKHYRSGYEIKEQGI